VSAAGTVTGGVGREEGRPPRRVVLLSESAGLASLLRHLLDGGDRLVRFRSLREAMDRDGLLDADAVVLDLPREGADTAVAHARHHWRGELVVLAERGQVGPDAAPREPAWTLLTRPFPAQALTAALGLPGVDPAALDEAGTDPAAAGPRPGDQPGAPGAARTRPAGWRGAPGAAGRGGWAALAAGTGVRGTARRATAWALAMGDRVAAARPVDRALRGLVAFADSWRAQRRVRVIGFTLFALVAFTIAFALAARERCGPGCDGFGTDFSPIPRVTQAPPGIPATTAPRRLPVVTAPTGTPGTGAFGGASSGRAATSTTRPATTTTSRRPDPGGQPRPTSPPTRPPTTPTTVPPVTTTPPTTAPPTTVEPPPP
jgi:hypothetical protein